MRNRCPTRHRSVAVCLALQLAAGAMPASGLPADGSTFLSDRGVVPGAPSAGGRVAAELFAGAASYAIPLELPPGTGGLTPSMTLRYTSAARGDSWVGSGWSLGLPSITRSLRGGAPRYDDTDRFELDGQELVPDATAPGRYRTRRESFLRIEREADGSFTVRQKDGTWLRLGTSAESRVEDGPDRVFQWLAAEMHDPLGNAFRVRWDRRDAGTAYLAELRYTLRRESNGTLRSLDGDPARDRVVRFELEPRPDVATSRIAGLERTLRHRLRAIEVRAAGGLTRRWRLAYRTSPDSQRSLLASVAVAGADAETTHPTPPRITRFRYRENVPGVEAGWAPDAAWAASWPPNLALVRVNGQDRGVRIADVDGDALPDLIKAYGRNPANGGDIVPSADNGVYLTTSAGFVRTPSKRYRLPVSTGVTGNRIPLGFAMELPSGLVWGTGMTPIDVTGDGRVDFVGTVGFPSGPFPTYHGPLAQSHQGPWCAATRRGFSCLSPDQHYRDHSLFMAYQADALNFATMQPAFLFAGGNAQFADVDGDGLVDVTVRGSDRFFPPGEKLLLCTQAHSASYVLLNLGGLRFQRLPIDPELRDFMTDCDRERAVISPYYQACTSRDYAAGCRDWIEHVQTDFKPSPVDGKTWLLAGHRDLGVVELDLDGDGLADLLRSFQHASSERKSSYLGNGRRGYVAAPVWDLPAPITHYDVPGPENPHSEGQTRDGGLRFADLNGDGRIDLVRADSAQPSVWLNAGLGATGTSPWRLQPAGTWQLPPGVRFVDREHRDTGARFVDFDGDGMPDIVRAQGSSIEVWRNLGAVPDLLVEVTEPLGARIHLGYTPSTRFDHRGDDDTPDLPRALPLLTRIETDDARGARSVRTIAYAGGLFDARRRELRGFRAVTETHADGTRTITRFHQDEARSGLVESVARRDANDALWLETFHEHTPDDDGKEPFIALPSAVTRVAWDGGSVPRRTRTEWRYDGGGPITLGNRTATIELGEVDPANRDLVAADTRSSVFEYAPENRALHLADRVSVTRLVGGLPGAGPVLRETRLLYDGASDSSTVPVRGLVTQRTDVLGEAGRPDPTTRFVYDEYGNLIALIDPRAAAGEGGGVTRFEHDPVFHAFRSAVVDPLGRRTELDYAADPSCPGVAPRGLGLAGRETGPNERQAGTARVRCYDAFGRITRERSPDGAGLSDFVYDDRPGLGGLVRIERATAAGALRLERVDLDGLGRPVAMRRTRASGPAVIETLRYDGLGRVNERSAPHFEGEGAPPTRHTYDALGRPTSTTLPGVGRVWTIARTPSRVRRTDPLGNVVVEERDAFERIVELQESDGPSLRITRFGWSAADELVLAVDPAGNRAELAYDRLGRRRLLRDPDLGEVRTAYDANGNEVEQISAAGRVSYAYDALERPVERRLEGVVEARFGYDTAQLGSGLLAWREDAAGRHVVIAYDGEGRPLLETHTRGTSTLAFATTYDPLGQPISRRYPTGESVVWHHDAAGQLERIELAGAPIATEILWGADGALAGWLAANGVRYAALRDTATRLPATLRVERGGAALEDLRFGFDAADRMLGIEDERDGTRSRSFVHDALGRLRVAEGPFGEGASRARLHYAYDLGGSLTCKDASALTDCTGGTSFEHPAPGEPRPHAPIRRNGKPLTYTAAGHLETIGDRRYGYDVLGRLTSVAQGGRLTALHIYDATGARGRTFDLSAGPVRTSQRVGDDFVWDVEQKRARIHVFLGGGPIATRAVPFDGSASGVVASSAQDDPQPAHGPASWLAVAMDAGPGARPTRAARYAVLLGLVAVVLVARIRPRPGAPSRARATVAGVTAITFGLATSAPAGARAPDGDLNRDRRLDAADALLAWEIARGARAPNPDELARGDVAPLGAAPERPGEIDPGDVTVLLRAIGGSDVDGDGLEANVELALGTSPFSSDSDGDGLSDSRERSAGSDPSDPDTDGDGRPDGSDPDPRRGIVYRQLDLLGSPLVVTRDDGAVLARPLHRPFGDAVSGAPGMPGTSEPGFGGRRLETDAGLYDFGARFYDPALGRFLQADLALADPLEPGAWNRYAYAAQDPLRRIDPTGHFSVFATLFGLAVGAVAAGSWARGEPGGEAVLGGLLNVITGNYRLGLTIRSDGAIGGDIGYIPTIRWLPGQDTVPASQQATQLRVLSTAELRFGDILLTHDGGLATAIGRLQFHGYGHGAFVLHADAFSVVVASSDNRGRYIDSSLDGAIGGRNWLVLRSGERLDERRAWDFLGRLDQAGGLFGGLRQYLGNGGGNVCTSFAAELYHVSGGRRIPDSAFKFVTPDEIIRYLGPPIGQVYIPRTQELWNAPPQR